MAISMLDRRISGADRVFAARRRVATIVLLLLGFALACGREPSGHSLPERIQVARVYLRDVWTRSGAPGLAVAVAIDGDVVWSEGFGFADVEHHVPATAQTVFRVGSVSKVFTAAAVANLAQQGKLDMDAPVQQYVPEFPDKGHTVTIRQLASHLSGVRHYRWDEVRPTRRFEDVIEALNFFKDDSLEFAPGSRFSYSSYGWVLVSAAVQRAAGEPFLEYMRTEVFDALGMRNTLAETNAVDLPNRAILYEGGRPVAPDELSYIQAAGGFLSTAEDMVRFGSAFLSGSDFFEPATLEVFFTRQSTGSGEPTRFGIGWIVDGLPTDRVPRCGAASLS